MVSNAEVTVCKKGGGKFVLFYQDKNNKNKQVETPAKDFSFKFKVTGNINHLSLQTGSEQAYIKKICVSSK
jgi:hypothetical protein